jgi:hypothetical protein
MAENSGTGSVTFSACRISQDESGNSGYGTNFSDALSRVPHFKGVFVNTSDAADRECCFLEVILFPRKICDTEVEIVQFASSIVEGSLERGRHSVRTKRQFGIYRCGFFAIS